MQRVSTGHVTSATSLGGDGRASENGRGRGENLVAGSIPLLLGAPPLSVQDVYSYGDARVFGRASGLWEAVVESGTFGIFVFMTGLLQDLLDATSVKAGPGFLADLISSRETGARDDKDPDGIVKDSSMQILNGDREIWDGSRWLPWKFLCRGGGSDLASKLKALLDESEGASAPPGSKSKGKGKGNPVDGDAHLLEALRKMVERADPKDLGSRLRQLLESHEQGAPLFGRAARRWKAQANKQQASAQQGQSFYSATAQAGFASFGAAAQVSSPGAADKGKGKGKAGHGRGDGPPPRDVGKASGKGSGQQGQAHSLSPSPRRRWGRQEPWRLDVTAVKACAAKTAVRFLEQTEDGKDWRWDIVVAHSAEQVHELRRRAKLVGINNLETRMSGKFSYIHRKHIRCRFFHIKTNNVVDF